MDAEKTYERCLAEGSIVIKDEIDINKATSLLISAKNELEIAKHIIKLSINTESHLFKTHYDILRELIDAFILFDKIEISNHICLFSYMIVKHPELELDWETLDGMRKLRNRICYYGKSLSKQDWKDYGLKFNVYIEAIKKQVEEKVKEQEDF